MRSGLSNRCFVLFLQGCVRKTGLPVSRLETFSSAYLPTLFLFLYRGGKCNQNLLVNDSIVRFSTYVKLVITLLHF